MKRPSSESCLLGLVTWKNESEGWIISSRRWLPHPQVSRGYNNIRSRNGEHLALVYWQQTQKGCLVRDLLSGQQAFSYIQNWKLQMNQQPICIADMFPPAWNKYHLYADNRRTSQRRPTLPTVVPPVLSSCHVGSLTHGLESRPRLASTSSLTIWSLLQMAIFPEFISRSGILNEKLANSFREHTFWREPSCEKLIPGAVQRLCPRPVDGTWSRYSLRPIEAMLSCTRFGALLRRTCLSLSRCVCMPPSHELSHVQHNDCASRPARTQYF